MNAKPDCSSGPCGHSCCNHSPSIAVAVRNLIWMTFLWISGWCERVHCSSFIRVIEGGEALFSSSWVFCSVGQISHAAVAVLASALICSEYFLICSEGSAALVSSVVLSLQLLPYSMSHQLLFACVNDQRYEKKPVLMCSFTRVFSHTFMPGGKISYLKPWNGNTSTVVFTCFCKWLTKTSCKSSLIFCSFATFDNWLVYFGRRET